MPGLSVSDVVDVQINMTPLAVPLRNFGALLIAGDSPVIDTAERVRQYATIDEVLDDFETTSPEYLAADLFFAQSPRPSILYLGRWASTNTSAVLHGGILTTAQQASVLSALQAITAGSMRITIDGTQRTISSTFGQINGGIFSSGQQTTLLTTLQAITNGAFNITIDGVSRSITGCNFSSTTSLTDCAAVITTAMGSWGSMSWNSTVGWFTARSATSGTSSSVTYAAALGSGTDISATLKLTSGTGASAPIAGTAGLNFSQITNLDGAATIIQTALTGATCVWDGTRFQIASLSIGPSSTLTYASSAGSGSDISATLKLTTGLANPPVNGIAAETALQAATILRSNPDWYGLQFASQVSLSNNDLTAVASFIEAASPSSVFGYTTQDTQCLDSTITNDILSIMSGLNLMRTFGQFSSSSPYASASLYGRAFTVNFEANNTTITLKFKQEPAVTGEQLTESQAAALKKKRGNVFVFYSNDAAIIQEGVMANGFFFDEVHGTDWQANRIQTDVFNALYTAPNKIPQTNAGVHVLITAVSNALQQGVNNGLIAPGQWNAAGFGQISQGQMLPTGYYVWAPLIEDQDQSIREQRIAPTIQAAIKLAGAIHFAGVIVNVNR